MTIWGTEHKRSANDAYFESFHKIGFCLDQQIGEQIGNEGGVTKNEDFISAGFPGYVPVKITHSKTKHTYLK